MKSKRNLILIILFVCLVTIVMTTTLFACSKNISVTLDYGYGSRRETIQVQSGTALAQPKAPQRDGYIFREWQLDEKKFDFSNSKIDNSITIVAVWDKAVTLKLVVDSKYTHKMSVKQGVLLSDVDLSMISQNGLEKSAYYTLDENAQPQNFATSNAIDKDITLIVDWASTGLEYSNNVVTGCKNYTPKTITVPYFHNNTRIDTIGKGAFKGSCASEILLPQSIVKIDASAFENCVFPSIQLPSGLQTIGASAFKNANKLEEIFIPQSVKEIGDWCFITTFADGDIENIPVSALTKVEFEKGSLINTIPTQCFEYKTKLQTIILPDNTHYIHPNAFNGCTSLSSVYAPTTAVNKATGRVVLPRAATSIGALAFKGCKAIKEAFLPDVQSCGGYIFADCDSKIVIYANVDRPNTNPQEQPTGFVAEWNLSSWADLASRQIRTVYKPYQVQLDLNGGKFVAPLTEQGYYWLGTSYDGYDNERLSERYIPQKDGSVFDGYVCVVDNVEWTVTDPNATIMDTKQLDIARANGVVLTLVAKYRPQ
ncbi:MAG: leucine-rich repeat protein [Clostridia bacterium]